MVRPPADRAGAGLGDEHPFEHDHVRRPDERRHVHRHPAGEAAVSRLRLPRRPRNQRRLRARGVPAGQRDVAEEQHLQREDRAQADPERRRPAARPRADGGVDDGARGGHRQYHTKRLPRAVGPAVPAAAAADSKRPGRHSRPYGIQWLPVTTGVAEPPAPLPEVARAPAGAAAPSPAAYRRLKRYAGLTGRFLAAILVLRLWWGHEAARRLAAEVEAIHARGEPVLRQDFEPEEVPDAEDAIDAYKRAAGSIAITPIQQGFRDRFNEIVPLTDADRRQVKWVLNVNASALQRARTARGLTRYRPATSRTPVIRNLRYSRSPSADLAGLLKWLRPRCLRRRRRRRRNRVPPRYPARRGSGRPGPARVAAARCGGGDRRDRGPDRVPICSRARSGTRYGSAGPAGDTSRA